VTRTLARRRSTTLIGLALVGSLLAAGLFTAGPASAHNFTKSDGDDTRGLLDLRSASVAHTSTAVVHSFRTFAGWAPSELGRFSSAFVIGIDKNNDARQAERCVIVFFARRLRATLTNCGRNAIAALPVSKPNRTTVKVTIPKSQTGLSYRWAVVSLYFEEKPCLNGCIDGIPNLSSFILHDLIPPTVKMKTTTLRIWRGGPDTTFAFPFSVSDTGGSGVDTWRVQRRRIGTSSWNNVTSGTGRGSHSPPVNGSVGRFQYRVVATDKHGNTDIGPIRLVYIPRDDRDLSPEGAFSVPPTLVDDAAAWEGTLSQMAVSDVFTYTFAPTGGDCTFELVGPGAGDWSVSVVVDGGAPIVIAATGAGQRQTLYSDDSCGTTYEFTVDSGTGFAIDAVLG
jgi:hypothetical protein